VIFFWEGGGEPRGATVGEASIGLVREMPSSRPTSTLLRQDQARQSNDRRTRLMAHALDALTAVVPAGVAVISPVDRKLEAFTTGPIVARLDPPELGLDLDRILVAHLTGASAEDPFEPKRWADRNVTVLGVGDVGAATAPPCDLLAMHRLSRRAAVFIRDRGRLVAYAVLMRALDDPDPKAVDIERLRRVQPLVEEALLETGERPATPATGADLRARGLTGRESEVAVLAATGATNAEIASELYISVNTVKTHLGRALAKLELRSRTELALRLSTRR
jgi:DNA-binding CsgD family transcriptional regulator